MTFLELTRAVVIPTPMLVNTAHVATIEPAGTGANITMSNGDFYTVLESLDAIAGWLAVAVVIVHEVETPDADKGDRNEQ